MRRVEGMVGPALRRQEARGLVEGMRRAGKGLWWRLADE